MMKEKGCMNYLHLTSLLTVQYFSDSEDEIKEWRIIMSWPEMNQPLGV